MKTEGRAKIVILTAAVMLSNACTYGTVWDGSTNQPVAESVAVFFDAWDTSSASLGDTPGSFRTTNGVMTWGTSDPRSNGVGGTYYLNPYAPLDPGDQTPTLVPPGWLRVSVVNFSTGVFTQFYRNHQYQDCNVLHDSPYSGTPVYSGGRSYPFSDASGFVSGSCAVESFTVWPPGIVHPVLPDLIVDPRTLRASHITAFLRHSLECPGHDCSTSKCLSIGTGIANVGSGNFEANAAGSDMSRVTQRIYNSDRTFNDVALPEASFVFETGHGHFHLRDLVVLRLRPYSSACPSEGSATNCPIVQTSRKLGFCLFDNYTLDSVLEAHKTRDYLEGACFGRGPDPSSPFGVGLSPGSEETYHCGVASQSIDVSMLPTGQYWLEAEVNTPANPIIMESDITNNVSRVIVSL